MCHIKPALCAGGGCFCPKSKTKYIEPDLENALLKNLQKFMLELGKSFAFVGRQERIRVEGEDFYVDLVFYNIHLKCYVLIDLKIGRLTHQDVGQMDTYVRIFDESKRGDDDNGGSNPEIRQPII